MTQSRKRCSCSSWLEAQWEKVALPEPEAGRPGGGRELARAAHGAVAAEEGARAGQEGEAAAAGDAVEAEMG